MYLNIVDIIIRAVISFLLLLIVTRLIGRKAISQMTFFDFAAAITMGTLAASIGMGNYTGSFPAAIVLLTFAFLAIITGYLHIKSFSFRKLVNSEPVTLIRNGEIVEDNMRRTRTTINALNALLREKNVFNMNDVEFAIMEVDGELSVLPKSQKQPLTPSDLNVPTAYKGLTIDIIINGNIMHENLRNANLNEKWLMDQLKNRSIDDYKKVFFAALDTEGNLYVSKGLKGKEKHGQYGIE